MRANLGSKYLCSLGSAALFELSAEQEGPELIADTGIAEHIASLIWWRLADDLYLQVRNDLLYTVQFPEVLDLFVSSECDLWHISGIEIFKMIMQIYKKLYTKGVLYLFIMNGLLYIKVEI